MNFINYSELHDISYLKILSVMPGVFYLAIPITNFSQPKRMNGVLILYVLLHWLGFVRPTLNNL